MKYFLIAVALVLLVVAGYLTWNSQSSSQPTNLNQSVATNQPVSTQSGTSNQPVGFSNPKKSAHYETNTPNHGATLAAVPINVVIDFNFDLAKPSAMKIIKNGVGGLDYGLGETVIDPNKLSMRRQMDSTAPDDIYTVFYDACWPDGSCHDGNFQFAIDRSQAASYSDMTGKKEVTIRLSQNQFSPQNIKVSKGTKIIWINDDAAEHYINADSHPAHTYHLAQNSKALKKGEQFSLVFDKVGVYPYHCSAHADSMTGSLIVE